MFGNKLLTSPAVKLFCALLLASLANKAVLSGVEGLEREFWLEWLERGVGGLERELIAAERGELTIWFRSWACGEGKVGGRTFFINFFSKIAA